MRPVPVLPRWRLFLGIVRIAPAINRSRFRRELSDNTNEAGKQARERLQSATAGTDALVLFHRHSKVSPPEPDRLSPQLYCSMKSLFTCILLAVATLCGCSTSNILSVGPDTYMVSASGAGFSSAGVREAVFTKANEFCTANDLVMMPVSFEEEGGVAGESPPRAKLTFRALPRGDADIHRPDLRQTDERIELIKNVDVTQRDETAKKPDVYAELLKLNDLRERGILTEEEFQAQKERLLGMTSAE